MKNKLERMGRRRFIETMVGCGASVAAVSVLSQPAAAQLIDTPGPQVPRLAGWIRPDRFEDVSIEAEALEVTGDELRPLGDSRRSRGRGSSRNADDQPSRLPVFYTISRSAWKRVESAHNARRQLRRQLDQQELPGAVWVRSAGDDHSLVVTVTERAISDHPTLHSRAEMESALPTSVPGSVPIRGRRHATHTDHPVAVELIDSADSPSANGVTPADIDPTDLYYRSDWDPAPVGATINYVTDLHDEVVGWGTSGFVVEDNGTAKLVTAGHNVDDIVEERVWAKKQAEWAAGEDFLVEEVVTRNVGAADPMDCGLLQPTQVGVTSNLARDNGGTGVRIHGGLGDDGIKDLEAGIGFRDSLFQQGAATGRSECEITKVGANYAFETDLVGSVDVQVGDSGGPIVYEDVVSFNGISIPMHWAAGIVSSSPGHRVWATSVPAIEREFGVEV